jgi:hypothetical protein
MTPEVRLDSPYATHEGHRCKGTGPLGATGPMNVVRRWQQIDKYAVNGALFVHDAHSPPRWGA